MVKSPQSIKESLTEWKEAIGLGADVKEIIKSIKKENKEILNTKVLYTLEDRISYSGRMSFPNPTTTHTFSPIQDDGKEMIKELRKDERERKKKQKCREDNHDYRFQRSDTIYRTYKVITFRTALRKMGKDERKHSTFGSTSTYYKVN